MLTYPSVQANYPNRALSSFTSMTSSYAENMNATAGTDAEAAYDIWINDLNKEVMFWVDNHGQTPAGSKVATVTLGGLTWNYYKTSGYYAFVLDHNATTGTVDLMAGIKYLISRGDLSASDKLWQVNFGFEICSTAGRPKTFHGIHKLLLRLTPPLLPVALTPRRSGWPAPRWPRRSTSRGCSPAAGADPAAGASTGGRAGTKSGEAQLGQDLGPRPLQPTPTRGNVTARTAATPGAGPTSSLAAPMRRHLPCRPWRSARIAAVN